MAEYKDTNDTQESAMKLLRFRVSRRKMRDGSLTVQVYVRKGERLIAAFGSGATFAEAYAEALEKAALR